MRDNGGMLVGLRIGQIGFLATWACSMALYGLVGGNPRVVGARYYLVISLLYIFTLLNSISLDALWRALEAPPGEGRPGLPRMPGVRMLMRVVFCLFWMGNASFFFERFVVGNPNPRMANKPDDFHIWDQTIFEYLILFMLSSLAAGVDAPRGGAGGLLGRQWLGGVALALQIGFFAWIASPLFLGPKFFDRNRPHFLSVELILLTAYNFVNSCRCTLGVGGAVPRGAEAIPAGDVRGTAPRGLRYTLRDLMTVIAIAGVCIAWPALIALAVILSFYILYRREKHLT